MISFNFKFIALLCATAALGFPQVFAATANSSTAASQPAAGGFKTRPYNAVASSDSLTVSQLQVLSIQELTKHITKKDKVILFDKLPATDVSKFLGWVGNSVHVSDICNKPGKPVKTGEANKPVFVKTDDVCGGYYVEPEVVARNPHPPAIGEAETTITATEPVLFSHYGTSKLSGNVTISQPGRQVTADHAVFYRDATTKEISAGMMVGSVNLREPGKVIVAQDGHWDVKSNLVTLNHTIYRFFSPAPARAANAWGRSLQITRDGEGVLKLKEATYTTCNPDDNAWKIWAKNVTLDKNIGRGSATNALIMVRDVPIFYFPYISFPIDKERKSGFLYPEFGYSAKSGLNFALPYYLNLAPNYDATITPRIFTNRGFMGQGVMRYLTPVNTGTLDLRYIANDLEFARFRKGALAKYADTSYRNSLARLNNAGNNRGFFSYKNKAIFNQHWSSNVNLNYATDDYFFQDFSGNAPTNDKDQLLNQADISYAGENWSFSALAQAFQTLRPINNQSAGAQEQYRRLPQLDAKGDYPNQKYGLDYQVVGKFVHFDYDHRYDPVSNLLKATGSRINFIPSVGLPLNWMGGYVTPKLQFHSTFYSLKDNQIPPGTVTIPGSGIMDNNINRVLPIFSADSGIFLSRSTSLFSNKYTQTLEPRLFYLFVPNRDQNNIPFFDTSLSAFNFDQLFATNRFSGYDRVGDANQVSVALTTRFLDSYTAEEKMRVSVGQMYALRKHTVCINSDCTRGPLDPLSRNKMSPTVGQVQYNLTSNWTATADAAWDINTSKVNNGTFNVRYHRGVNRIVNLGYNFVQDGDVIPTMPKLSRSLNRVNLSFAWPIKDKWNVVGDWNYNLSHRHPQEFFYGLEYQNCCWAVRLVQRRSFTGTDEKNNNTFRWDTYLQFMLKGLGSAGLGDANEPLTRLVPGYTNSFLGAGK